MIGWILAIGIVALLAYVRLVPSEPARWHVDVAADADRNSKTSAVRVINGDTAILARMHNAALALPRTSVLAGSVEAGKVTYITRSKVIGFPDYTTMQLVGDQIRMFARLRFGKSDLGVNRGRLEHLVRAAQP